MGKRTVEAGVGGSGLLSSRQLASKAWGRWLLGQALDVDGLIGALDLRGAV